MKNILLGLTAIIILIGAFVFYRYKNPIQNVNIVTPKKSEDLIRVVQDLELDKSKLEKNFLYKKDEFSSWFNVIDSSLNPGCNSFNDKVYFTFKMYKDSTLSDLFLIINNPNESYTNTTLIRFNIDGANPFAIPDQQEYKDGCNWIVISHNYRNIFTSLANGKSAKMRLEGDETNILEVSVKEMNSLNKTYWYYTTLKKLRDTRIGLKSEIEKENKDGEKLILY